MIRVGIVDDHDLLIRGLSRIVNEHSKMNVVYESVNGISLIESGELDTIDILLMDIEMPEMDGVELSKRLLEKRHDLKIIILTMYGDQSLAEALKNIGVRAYLSKTIRDHLLVEIIEKINLGGTHFEILRGTNPSKPSSTQNDKIYYKERFKELSERELEIIRLIVEGMSNHEMSDVLHISHRTVDTHRTNIMRKIGVSNVASLVRIALKSGAVS